MEYTGWWTKNDSHLAVGQHTFRFSAPIRKRRNSPGSFPHPAAPSRSDAHKMLLALVPTLTAFTPATVLSPACRRSPEPVLSNVDRRALVSGAVCESMPVPLEHRVC